MLFRHQLRQAIKPGAANPEAGVFQGQFLAFQYCLGIAVHTDQTGAGVQPGQQRAAVTAAAKGAVHVQAVGSGGPHFQYLLQHYRLVLVLPVVAVRHGRLPSLVRCQIQNERDCTLSGMAS